MHYRDWLTLSTHVIWCYDHVILSRQTRATHSPSADAWHTRAWLVRSGWIEVEQNKLCKRAEPGQWVFLDNTPHKRRSAKETHILSVAFEATWPDGTSLFSSGFPFVVGAAAYPELEPKLETVAKTMGIPAEAYDIRDQPMDYWTTLRLQRDFCDWLLVLLDVLHDHDIAPTTHLSFDTRVMQAVRLLDAHPLGTPLNQQAIAESVGISQVQLTRIFVADLRVTPRQYFEKRRIEHARRHLMLSDVQIKEVAITLGFYDVAHFSKWFKKIHHVTPTAYSHIQQGKQP